MPQWSKSKQSHLTTERCNSSGIQLELLGSNVAFPPLRFPCFIARFVCNASASASGQ